MIVERKSKVGAKVARETLIVMASSEEHGDVSSKPANSRFPYSVVKE